MRESDLFTARAAASHAEAEIATLDNVRDRALRAEAAWTEMAVRSRRAEIARAAREGAPEPVYRDGLTV